MKNSMIPAGPREAPSTRRCRAALRCASGLTVALTLRGASANGVLENVPRQFPMAPDKWSKSPVLDPIEKMKGGYYDAVKNTSKTSYANQRIKSITDALAARGVQASRIGVRWLPEATDNSITRIGSGYQRLAILVIGK